MGWGQHQTLARGLRTLDTEHVELAVNIAEYEIRVRAMGGDPMVRIPVPLQMPVTFSGGG
jgi:hypothetical protein